MGGFFPAEIKKAGYDGIVLIGRAQQPIYIFIENNEIHIKNAGRLWGKTNSAAQEAVRSETSEEAKIISIGPGAESKTRIGILYTDLASSASMGFGSVMGSKNVKAIAARGTNAIPAAHPEKIKEIRKKHSQMTGRNFINLFGAPHPRPDIDSVKKKHCHGCPQGCWRSLQRISSGGENIHKCQTSMFYTYWDRKLHGSITDASFMASKIANDYSICVMDLTFLLLLFYICTGLPI